MSQTQAPGRRLRVNGAVHAVQSPPGTPLLYVLRDERHPHGPRFGYGLGQRGARMIIATAPAIANAVFDATSARLRTVPFTPERVLAALRARSVVR